MYFEHGLLPADIPVHPNHWCMTPKSKNFTTPGALVPGTARGRSFRTLDWEQPSPTIAYGHREVHVHPDDLGKVIGRGGRTATALRTLVAGIGGRGIRVDVVDTDQ